MYDKLLVRKRRRRRIAELVTIISSFGIASLVIISFLGRSVGTFTVSLNNSEVNLALIEKENSTAYSTYLRINESAKFIEHSYDFFKYKLDVLDDEETPYTYGEFEHTYLDKTTGQIKTGTCLEFLKYTFYVKNVGSKTASYDMKINIDDRTRSDDNTGRSLDDTLRVMVFENEPDSGEHNYLVYAKKAAENNIDKDGNKTDREFISDFDPSSNRETDKYPLAERFLDGNTIAQYNVSNFIKNEMRRYTIVIWLEGADPQSKPDIDYPEGATLKLGVDISAHENANS
ncbi:MAG: hypothetical protein J6N95_06170 [Bacilli bacterium]|nr:hypothetical protein [Bacilli bacterium]